MKQKYESAKVEVILTDADDVITQSDSVLDAPLFTGPIGGGGMDDNGWT